MKRQPRSKRGFTLVEAIFGSTLAAMLLLAMLSTYLFLGRNLTKLANFHVLEEKNRVALGFMTRDFQMASAVTSPASGSVQLTLPLGTVTYTYASSTLTRTATFGALQNIKLLKDDCTSFELHYYSTFGDEELITDLSTPANTTLVPLSVKRIRVAFTTSRGSVPLRTFAELKSYSARVLMRNKPLPTGS